MEAPHDFIEVKIERDHSLAPEISEYQASNDTEPIYEFKYEVKHEIFEAEPECIGNNIEVFAQNHDSTSSSVNTGIINEAKVDFEKRDKHPVDLQPNEILEGVATMINGKDMKTEHRVEPKTDKAANKKVEIYFHQKNTTEDFHQKNTTEETKCIEDNETPKSKLNVATGSQRVRNLKRHYRRQLDHNLIMDAAMKRKATAEKYYKQKIEYITELHELKNQLLELKLKRAELEIEFLKRKARK